MFINVTSCTEESPESQSCRAPFPPEVQRTDSQGWVATITHPWATGPVSPHVAAAKHWPPGNTECQLLSSTLLLQRRSNAGENKAESPERQGHKKHLHTGLGLWNLIWASGGY